MPQFIPGIALNLFFYREAVAPILASAFPRLRYSDCAFCSNGATHHTVNGYRFCALEWRERSRTLVARCAR